jgi:hypothetical protein
MRRLIAPLLLALAALAPALAQQQPPPPPAYTPTEDERKQLDEKKEQLRRRLSELVQKKDARFADVAVFFHCAEMADRLNLYTNRNQIPVMLRGLDTGLERAAQLAKGETPWVTRPGRSLRGYQSRIDGSYQPYSVILPAGYDARDKKTWRVDVVLHGRGPTEVTFLQQSEPAPGSNAAKPPAEPFIEVQPFGRANNGWRWAGETDVFEALGYFAEQYPIDRDRVILRGFSMGGHGAWHIGLHYSSLWAGVSPGAGFTDTRKYLKLKDPVPAYQEKAWHIYDAVDYGLNLFNTPFIGYGGEKDPQLQATLNMREVAEREGMPLEMVIGPNTEHRYHPESFKQIMHFLATKERDPKPRRVKLTTWSLKHNRAAWVIVDAMEEHYTRATVDADATSGVIVKTTGVTGLSLDPLPVGVLQVTVDGQEIKVEPNRPVRAEKRDSKWRLRSQAVTDLPDRRDPIRKRNGVQGPIDDAFTDRFIAVVGTGTPWSGVTTAYAESELKRLQEEWRFGFRGEVRVMEDSAIQKEEYEDANLILFGDPGSNKLMAKIIG